MVRNEDRGAENGKTVCALLEKFQELIKLDDQQSISYEKPNQIFFLQNIFYTAFFLRKGAGTYFQSFPGNNQSLILALKKLRAGADFKGG